MTIYFLPLYLFAFPREVTVLFVSANIITGLLEHANIRFKAGPFNYVFNSAELHRWHHSQVFAEANQNFGKVLCVWDLVFGTWLGRDDQEMGDVGLTPGEGLVPPTLRGQWSEPFRVLGKTNP
jgi:ornithine lipid hydroxylase